MCGTLAVEIRANSCDKTLRKAGGNKVMNLAPKHTFSSWGVQKPLYRGYGGGYRDQRCARSWGGVSDELLLLNPDKVWDLRPIVQ
jgi:hypothetical protein